MTIFMQIRIGHGYAHVARFIDLRTEKPLGNRQIRIAQNEESRVEPGKVPHQAFNPPMFPANNTFILRPPHIFGNLIITDRYLRSDNFGSALTLHPAHRTKYIQAELCNLGVVEVAKAGYYSTGY